MEILDIYDINRNKTGKTIIRGMDIPNKAYRLVVHVCIFNSKNEMLIQKRQPFKEKWPSKWDLTAGGSAVQGETSQDAVERELFEELGIRINFKDIRPNMTINFENGFDDIYLIQRDIDINSLKLQNEEVQKVEWASKEKIFSLIKNEEFVPYHLSLIQLFFDTKNQYGCIMHKEKIQ